MAERVAGRLTLTLAVAGVSLVLALTYWTQELALRDTSHASGWTLLGLSLFLLAFGARKKLPHPPLLSARLWLLLHLAIGIVALVVFLSHLRGWPDGRLEWLLFVLFALTVLSGLAGWLLSRIVPRLLTALGDEAIYERIPLSCLDLRERAQSLVATAAGASSRSILGQIYRRDLAAFFALPRPWWRRLGPQRRGRRVRQRLTQQRRYLSADEQRAAAELADLIRRRATLDSHYLWQGLLKGWLFFHIPLGCALLIVVALHVLVVHAFSGAVP